MKKQKLSAIIACYKDEKAIPIMYKRLTSVFKKIKVDYEIIFVNDGSPDGSENILKNITEKDPHVIAIHHSRNFGTQMAFASGMDYATGDALVFLDGDLQDPPEIIENFYSRWIDGYDVVYGVRTKREAPLFMRFMYKLFYRVFRKLSSVSMPLDAGDFSLIDKKVIKVLKTFPENNRLLRGMRAWVGFRQVGVSYSRPERMFGKTNNNFFSNFNFATKSIFSYSLAPLQIMTLSSLILFALSALSLVAQTILFLLFPDNAPKDISIIMTGIVFVGSLQLLCISIVGEYIGTIFEEIKGRPKYVVKNIVKKNK